MKRQAGKLEGTTVLVTRSREQAAELTTLLQEQGATVVEIPMIHIVLQTEQAQRMKEALQRIDEYSWLILTSANTAHALDKTLKEMEESWHLFDSLRIACIGRSTAERVRQLGGKVSVVPPRFQAESLIEELLKEGVAGQKALLPRAKGSREILTKELTRHGMLVQEIHIYSAELPESSRQKLVHIFQDQPVDFITFTSSSTVRNFMEMAGPLVSQIDPQKTRIACIGPITGATLREYGIPAVIEAKEFTIVGLVQAMVDFQNRSECVE